VVGAPGAHLWPNKHKFLFCFSKRSVCFSCSFLKKRTKKLLRIWFSFAGGLRYCLLSSVRAGGLGENIVKASLAWFWRGADGGFLV
jgi:hypothetical protein